MNPDTCTAEPRVMLKAWPRAHVMTPTSWCVEFSNVTACLSASGYVPESAVVPLLNVTLTAVVFMKLMWSMAMYPSAGAGMISFSPELEIFITAVLRLPR